MTLRSTGYAGGRHATLRGSRSLRNLCLTVRTIPSHHLWIEHDGEFMYELVNESVSGVVGSH